MPRPGRISEAAERRVRRLGQRWTPARASLVSSLAAAASPRTVAELSLDAGIPVSSAYRTVAVLEEAGVVHRIDAGDQARYELSEDLSERHHHHLICNACGRVDDFEPAATLEEKAVDTLARAARKQGWSVLGHRLDVVGACPACSA